MGVKISRLKTNKAVPPNDPAPPAPALGQPESRPRPIVPPRAPNSSKTQNKVLLSVLDGQIQWDKMSVESRKQFEQLFKNKDFLSQFGLTGKEKAFDPEQMKHLYDGLSMAYQTIARVFLKFPPQVLKFLVYTDSQKNMLAEPTANLANKFAPAFLQQHQELLVFATVFLTCTQSNFRAAFEEMKKMALQQQQRGPQVVPARAAAPPPQVIVPPVPAPAPAERPAPEIEVPFSMPSEFADSFQGDSLG